MTQGIALAPGPDSVVRARGLRKRYGDVTAVAGIDLDIRSGEVFALLGPNGAGKTTTVEILEGYRHRDGGTVRHGTARHARRSPAPASLPQPGTDPVNPALSPHDNPVRRSAITGS
jgi:ABC-type multidrug transport system ATPase subunit